MEVSIDGGIFTIHCRAINSNACVKFAISSVAYGSVWCIRRRPGGDQAPALVIRQNAAMRRHPPASSPGRSDVGSTPQTAIRLAETVIDPSANPDVQAVRRFVKTTVRDPGHSISAAFRIVNQQCYTTRVIYRPPRRPAQIAFDIRATRNRACNGSSKREKA